MIRPSLASRFHKRRIARALLYPPPGKAHHHYKSNAGQKHRWLLDTAKQSERGFERPLFAVADCEMVINFAARPRDRGQELLDDHRGEAGVEATGGGSDGRRMDDGPLSYPSEVSPGRTLREVVGSLEMAFIGATSARVCAARDRRILLCRWRHQT
jgi:hypothetical protein